MTSAVGRFLKSAPVVALTLAIGGCATLKPKLALSSFGDVNLKADQALVEKAKTIDDTSGVRVVAGSTPTGLSLEENSSKLSVLPGYEQRYSIIGTVDSDYLKAQSWLETIWYPTLGYDQGWREVLCYPQAPVNALTLGLWGSLSPTGWFCKRMMPGDEGDRKEALIDVLKRGVKAAGGNLLLITGETSLSVTTYNRYGDNLGTTLTPSTALRGFIIKDNG